MVSEFNVDNFEKEISDGLVVVDFWAEWCGPCKMLGPIFEEVSKEFEGKVKFGKLNIDDGQELAQKFQVMGIPTILFFKDGQLVDRTTGLISKEELEKKVNEQL